MKAKKEKTLFKGVFAFKNKMRILRSWSYSDKQAAAQMMRRIAKEDGIHPGVVFAYFKENEAYQIKPEEENHGGSQ